MPLEIDEIALLNPPDDVYFAQLNIIRDIFNNDYESALMSEAIKNTKLLFFQTIGELNTFNQVECISGNLELEKETSSAVDVLDSISGFVEIGSSSDKNQGTFSLNTDAAHKIEGTGSIKLDVDNPQKKYDYVIEKTISTEDWSSYNEVKIWLKSTYVGANPPDLVLIINGKQTSPLTTFNGSGYYTFDVSAISRSAVTTWAICLKNHGSTAYVAYADDLLGVGSAVNYYLSGWGESATIDTVSDIDAVYIYDKIASEPINTAVALKVSLDGGTTWHTVAGDEYQTWIDVSTWVESFIDTHNLRVRIELDTTDNTVTPSYDDVMVAYKLKV